MRFTDALFFLFPFNLILILKEMGGSLLCGTAGATNRGSCSLLSHFWLLFIQSTPRCLVLSCLVLSCLFNHPTTTATTNVSTLGISIPDSHLSLSKNHFYIILSLRFPIVKESRNAFIKWWIASSIFYSKRRLFPIILILLFLWLLLPGAFAWCTHHQSLAYYWRQQCRRAINYI